MAVDNLAKKIGVNLENLITVDIFDKIAVEVKSRLDAAHNTNSGFLGNLLKKKNVNKAVTGESVGNNSAMGKSRVAILTKDPLNMQARLDLISPYVRQETTVTRDTLKEVYINALFCLSLGKITSDCINFALIAQKNYLTKLKMDITEEGKKLMARMDDFGPGKPEGQILRKQYKERVECINFINDCLRILPNRRVANDLNFDLSQLMMATEEDIKKQAVASKKDPAHDINEVLKGTAVLPPLEDKILELTNIARGKFPTRPIGFIYQAKIYRINALIAEAGFMKEKKSPSGEVNPDKLHQFAKSEMKKAMTSITNAVGKLPDNPKDFIDQACVEEYAILILEFNRMIPSANILEHLKRAVVLLSKIISSENRTSIEELQSRMNKMIEDRSAVMSANSASDEEPSE
ncbi:MAG: hypothetical protein HQM12_08925 [SAR324 cluster bacterium]|nr:hypothetical protein [SAR324 cluster bacterium]